MLYEKYPELKYKYRNREFWCRGYYVDTAGQKCTRRYRSTSNVSMERGQSRRTTDDGELLKSPFTGSK